MDTFSTPPQSRGKTMYWVFGFIAVIAAMVLYAYATQRIGGSPATDESELRGGTPVNENPASGDEGMDTGADVPADGEGTGVASLSQEVRTFEVRGSMFKYDVKEMRVREGEVVKIIFTNDEGFHDWVLDEFNARTEKISAGKTVEVTFTADKKGTYEYYCSVGDHRAKGMKGTLIVE